MRFVESPSEHPYYRFRFVPVYELAELREHQNHAGYSTIDLTWGHVLRWIRDEIGPTIRGGRCDASYCGTEHVDFREADDALAFKLRWG